MGYAYPSYETVTPMPNVSEIATLFAGLGVFLAIVLAVLAFISFAFLIACYIFNGVGICKMMKNLKLKNGWMAFFPFLANYAFGKVAEQYIKKDGKKSAKFSVILLVVSIVYAFLSLVVSVISFFSGFISGLSGSDEAAGIMFIVTILFSAFVTVCTWALLAIQYVALWRVFAIFANKRATLYTVLSIFLPLSPFFIFASRNKTPVCVEQTTDNEFTAEAVEI